MKDDVENAEAAMIKSRVYILGRIVGTPCIDAATCWYRCRTERAWSVCMCVGHTTGQPPVQKWLNRSRFGSGLVCD